MGSIAIGEGIITRPSAIFPQPSRIVIMRHYYLYRGDAQFALGNYELPVNDYSIAIELDSTCPVFYVNPAKAKGQLNDLIGNTLDL